FGGEGWGVRGKMHPLTPHPSPPKRGRGGKKVVEVVAADTTQNPGEAPFNLIGVLGGKTADGAATLSLQGPLPAFLLQFRRRQWTCVDHAAIYQGNFQLQDVIARLAVHDRVRAGRVVGNHAANRGPVRRGDVGGELEAMWPHRLVEIIEDTAGTYPRP